MSDLQRACDAAAINFERSRRHWAIRVSGPLSRSFEVYMRSLGRYELANMYREHADWIEAHGEDPLSCCVSRPENEGAQ